MSVLAINITIIMSASTCRFHLCIVEQVIFKFIFIIYMVAYYIAVFLNY